LPSDCHTLLGSRHTPYAISSSLPRL
jgi:hypothetical protein